jgi:hypothetical protein
MIELYTRFSIKVQEHLITLVDNQTLYAMPDNFMYHLRAFGEVPEDDTIEFVELAINESDQPLSIFFPDWKTVQIPKAILGSYVSILYATNPDHITTVQALDGVSIIQIPDTLVDCLLSYIGHRAHIGVKNDKGFEDSAHFKRFEFNCKKARDLGVAFPPEELTMKERIFNRGFV